MLVAASIVTSWRCLFCLLLPLHARAGDRGNDAVSPPRRRGYRNSKKVCVYVGTGERHGDRLLARQRRAAPDGHGPCRETCRGARLPERVLRRGGLAQGMSLRM